MIFSFGAVNLIMQDDPTSPPLTRKQEAQFRVMRVIAVNPRITQRQLAIEMGVSLGRAHYCLSSLVEVGWVKIDHFRASSNKMQYAYILTPSGIAHKAAIASRFLKRKTEEYDALKREIDCLHKELDYIVGQHIAK